MKQERGDLLAFVHGVINLIWPVFAYDLAELASLIIGGYSWATMVPSTIMLILPIVSDVVGRAHLQHRHARVLRARVVLLQQAEHAPARLTSRSTGLLREAFLLRCAGIPRCDGRSR